MEYIYRGVVQLDNEMQNNMLQEIIERLQIGKKSEVKHQFKNTLIAIKFGFQESKETNGTTDQKTSNIVIDKTEVFNNDYDETLESCELYSSDLVSI